MNKKNNTIFYLTAIIFSIIGLFATITNNGLLLILSFLITILIVECVVAINILEER